MFLPLQNQPYKKCLLSLSLEFIQRYKRFFSHLRLDRKSMVSVNFGSVVVNGAMGLIASRSTFRNKSRLPCLKITYRF